MHEIGTSVDCGKIVACLKHICAHVGLGEELKVTTVLLGYLLTSLHLSILLSSCFSSIFPSCFLVCPGRESFLDVGGRGSGLGEILRINFRIIVVRDKGHIDGLRLTQTIVLRLYRDDLCSLGASDDFVVAARRWFNRLALTKHEVVVQVFLVRHQRGGLGTELSH